MTKLQIVQNVYEALGEPSDLQYLDDNDNVLTGSVGWRRMIDAINLAILEISVWKFPDGRTIRFRYLEDVAHLQTVFETAAVAGAVTGSSILTTTLTNTTLNTYSGCAMRIGTTIYRIRYSQPNVTIPTNVDLMLDSLITVADGAALSVSKREYRFVDQTITPFTTTPTEIAYTAANGAPLEILNVYDTAQNSELELVKKYDPLISLQAVFQTPAQYYKIAQGLRFESYPDSSRLYTVRYMRGPRTMDYTTLTEEPELPVQFHEAVVLYCLWWGYRRMQENNSAYSTKQDLVDMLRRVRTEYDLQGELTSHQFSFNVEE